MDTVPRTKLILCHLAVTILAVVVALTGLWVGALRWLEIKANQAFDHKGLAVAMSIQATIEDSLAFGAPLGETRGAKGYLDHLLAANPDIRSITIADSEGRPLFSRGDLGVGAPPSPAGTAGVATVPVRGAAGVVGAVAVTPKRNAAEKVLSDQGPTMLMVLLFSLGASGLWARRAARRHCVVRLEALYARLREGADGQFEEFECVPGGDEVALFSQALAVTALHIRERASRFGAYADELRGVLTEPAAMERLEGLVAEVRSLVGDDMLNQRPGADQPPAEINDRASGLSLRSRVMAIEVVAILLASVAMGLAWAYSERLTEEAVVANRTAGFEAAWRKLMAQKIAAIAAEGRQLVVDRRLVEIMAQGDAHAVDSLATSLEAPLIRAKLVTDIEIADLDGNILAGDSLLQGTGILGKFAITTIIRTGEPITGLGLTAKRRPAAIFAHPVFDGPRPLGAAILIFDAAPLFDQLAALAGGEVFAVDLHGQLVYGQHAELWRRVAPSIDFNRQGTVSIPSDASTYSVTVIGTPSFDGGRLGYLVAVRDVTTQQARIAHLRLAFTGFALILLITVVVLVFHYLRRAFWPLDSAISVLNLLARGETSLMVSLPVTADEVGRITHAIRVFRDRTFVLARVAEERSRRRRRQERLIRRQMLTLAETLQNDAREAVLKDLDQIEQEAQSQSAGADVAAELDALAIAFQTMACRVQEQHVEVDMLVGELREALKSKTAFIALQQELEIARELQLSILPKVEANEEEFSAHALMIPAKEVGGDFYDFFYLSPRRVGIVVADVSGKGVPAALFMAVSRTLLKATATFGLSPGPCLTKLNNLLAEENEKSLFVTAFYGILDLNIGVLTYANGGHNPPMLVGHDGVVTPLEGTNGVALALVRDLPYLERKVTLRAGDTLVLYTDGVTEAKSPDDEEFGDDRLVDLLSTLGGKSSDVIIERVLEALGEFVSGGPQADDITCLAFHCRQAVAQIERHVTTFENTLTEVPRLLAEVERFGSAVGASREVIFNLSLGLDEIFTNVVSYGYGDSFRHEINLILEYDGQAITARLDDDGKPFDPLALAPPPDIDSSIEDRAIGGLGIHLVRNLMDEVHYNREGRRNQMTLVKRLTSEDETGEDEEALVAAD